jgi:hypothetical protein
MQSKYDYTQYNGGAPSQTMPERPSTKQELAMWMNAMAASIGSDVYHWVTENTIHYLRIYNGKIVERGIL